MATEFYNRNWRMLNSWNGSTDNNSKVSNYSMSFDGGDDHILTDLTPDSYTGFSISAWVYANSLGSYNVVASQYRANNPSNSAWFLETIGNNMAFGVVNGTTLKYAQKAFSISGWYHVVGVWDGSTVEVYIDGAASGSPQSISAMNTGTVNMAIGGLWNNGGTAVDNGFWDGKIDEVAIFDYALSAQQISDLQGSSSTGVGNPMSLSAKPKFYYPIGDYAAFNGSEYLVPNGALSDYNFVLNPTGLQNQYIAIDKTFPYSSGFTISLWVNFINTSPGHPFGSAGILFDNRNAANPSTERIIISASGNDGQFYFYCFDKVAKKRPYPNVNIQANRWYHVVGVFDPSLASENVKLYIDNYYLDSDPSPTVVSITDENATIGGLSTAPTTYEPRARMSNISIFNTPLPATGTESVDSLYNNGTPPDLSTYNNLEAWWKLDASATFDGSNWSIPDDSSNSNTGTSSGMTAANLVQSNLLITQPYSRYALDFDGTGDKIDLGLLSFLNNVSAYTLSMWVNPSTLSGLQYLFAIVTSSTERIYINLNNTLPNVGMSNGTNTNESFSSSPLTVNNWHHLSIVFDGTQTGASRITFYLDGVAQTTTKTTWDSTTPTFVTNAFLGNYAQYSLYYFNGKMSNVSIFDSALTSTQVTELYNQGKPGNLNNHSAYSDLSSWWQLGENMSYDSNVWTVLDEKGTNNGTGANLAPAEDSIVNGVGTSGNGLSDGMGGADNIVGDAPYSTANAVSYGMGVDARVSGSGNVPS